MKNIRAKRVASKGQSGGWKHAGLLLSGVGISNLGDFIYIVAINLMVLNMTQSPAAVAGLWIISPIASVCTKFWSGSLIDRYDQRQLMIGADMLRALLVAALPLMSSLWLIRSDVSDQHVLFHICPFLSGIHHPAGACGTTQTL